MREKKKKSVKAIAGTFKDQHAQFLEEGEFIKAALPYIYTDDAANNVKKTLSFVEKKIIHLDEEEEKLFRVLLAGDNLKVKQFIRELQHEHVRILSIYDEIKDIVLGNGFSLKDKKTRDRFVGLVKEMVEFFLNHARKEDEYLFPLFVGRNIKLDLHF
jgi:iron-sulfur cluster repair protein YtfE (RIC family)